MAFDLSFTCLILFAAVYSSAYWNFSFCKIKLFMVDMLNFGLSAGNSSETTFLLLKLTYGLRFFSNSFIAMKPPWLVISVLVTGDLLPCVGGLRIVAVLF